jgi:hypothetical protein
VQRAPGTKGWFLGTLQSREALEGVRQGREVATTGLDPRLDAQLVGSQTQTPDHGRPGVP